MATRLTPNQVIEVRIFYLLPYARVMERRHKRLKIFWQKYRVGSNPTFRTNRATVVISYALYKRIQKSMGREPKTAPLSFNKRKVTMQAACLFRGPPSIRRNNDGEIATFFRNWFFPSISRKNHQSRLGLRTYLQKEMGKVLNAVVPRKVSLKSA